MSDGNRMDAATLATALSTVGRRNIETELIERLAKEANAVDDAGKIDPLNLVVWLVRNRGK